MPTQPESGGRLVPVETGDPIKPGNSDAPKPTPSSPEKTGKGSKVYGAGEIVNNHQVLHNCDSPDSPTEICDHKEVSFSCPGSSAGAGTKPREGTKIIPEVNHDIDYREPKPPKVLMEDPNISALELRSQIQMYAATEYVGFNINLSRRC